MKKKIIMTEEKERTATPAQRLQQHRPVHVCVGECVSLLCMRSLDVPLGRASEV